MTDQNTSKPARRMARMPAENADSGPDQVLPQTEATAAPGARPESKIAHVTCLLERSEGASLDEMVSATGWQARVSVSASAEMFVASARQKAGARRTMPTAPASIAPMSAISNAGGGTRRSLWSKSWARPLEVEPGQLLD